MAEQVQEEAAVIPDKQQEATVDVPLTARELRQLVAVLLPIQREYMEHELTVCRSVGRDWKNLMLKLDGYFMTLRPESKQQIWMYRNEIRVEQK